MDTYELGYDDFFFTLMIPDYWVKIYRGKKKEPLYGEYCEMLDLVKKTSKERYVLDVGANHGLFSVPASMLGYKVVGFEPVAANIYTLGKAKELNNLTDFNMFHLALSNKNEEVDIFVPDCPDNSSFSKEAAISNMREKGYREEKVTTVRFDDWIKDNPQYENIGFIKMDTQGAEYLILEGMKEFLTNANDIYLQLEYEPHLLSMGYSYQQLDELILSYGFVQIGKVGNDKIWFKK